MLFRKNKPEQRSMPVNEDDIQAEIRRRILKESLKKSGAANSEEATQATLDALEDMVSLSREEMETIAEQVRSEFAESSEKASAASRSPSIALWLALTLVLITFFLVRRGSSWFLFAGLILLFILLNLFFRKPPSNNDDSNS